MMSICRTKDMPPPAASSPTDFFKHLEGSERVEETCSLETNAEGEAVKKPTITTESLKEEEGGELLSEENCRTPTAKECRIEEMLTCPPAPRKRWPSFSSPLSFRVKETEAEYFFSHPDLESVFAVDDTYKVKFKF